MITLMKKIEEQNYAIYQLDPYYKKLEQFDTDGQHY